MFEVKRFYQKASVRPHPEGYGIFLDEGILRTPKKTPCFIPSFPFARRIAQEWNAQKETLDLAFAPATRLGFSALDHPQKTAAAIEKCFQGWIDADVALYRAIAAPDLEKLQDEAHGPLLDFFAQEFTGAIVPSGGLGRPLLETEDCRGLQAAWLGSSVWRQAALVWLSRLLNSPLWAWGILKGVEAYCWAFRACFLEEIYQASRWGEDLEAQKRLSLQEAEGQTISNILCDLQKEGI